MKFTETLDEHVVLYHLQKGRELLARYSNRKIQEGAPYSEVADIEKGIQALSQEIKERRRDNNTSTKETKCRTF